MNTAKTLLTGKITKDYVELTPAYGRDYVFGSSAKADFLNGRDFVLNDITSPWDGKPCAIGDFADGVIVVLRFSKCRKLTTLTVHHTH